jgi:hypothetical protein
MRTGVAFLIFIGFAADAYAEVTISDRDRDNYCRFYADQAVKDNEDNIKLGCGYTGPEWQSIFGAHYGWCMRLRSDVLTSATDAQKASRGAAITICYCHHYAREAVKAAKENVSLGCRFSGARWIDHHASHYNWCRSLGPHSRAHITEEQARIQDLQRCKQDKIKQGAKTSPGDAPTTADPKAGRTLGKRKLPGKSQAPAPSGNIECKLCSSKGECSPAGNDAECALRKATAEKMTVDPFLKWSCTCSAP